MAALAAIAALLLLAPLSGSAFATNLANIIMLHAMPALGLALLMGYAGQISLGQSAFYGLGAYGTAILSVKLGFNPWLSLICAIVVVSLICDALGRIIFRLHGHHLAIATLGLAIIVSVAFVELRPWTGGPNGLGGIQPLAIAGYLFDSDARFFMLAYAAFLAVLWCAINLVRSPIGLVMQGISESERASASLGADVAALKRRILVLGGAFSALGGGLYAHYIGFVSPQPFSVVFSIKLLVMVAIGGFGNIAGVVFGVAFVTLITEPLQELGYFDVVVFGMLLVASMLIAPDGLPAGAVRLWRRLFASGRMTTLDLDRVGKRFFGLQALEDVSFKVGAGELVALIGPNGAGKSTLINIIAGDHTPSAGEVTFGGRLISGLPPHAVNALGLTRTYQSGEIFGLLSVLDNAMIGGVRRVGATMRENLVMLPSARRKRADLARIALEALEVVGLGAHATARAANLSAGQQRLLAIARVLANGNDWLILDEPGAGLNHVEKQELADVIRKLSQCGKTILFVEHDMGLVGDLAQRVIVLDRGRLIADGPPAEVRKDRGVIDAYLGVPQVMRREETRASRSAAPLVEASDLVVRYGVNPALKGVSLRVEERSIVAVVGPNGAGKSTLLKALIRALPIASGTLSYAGASALSFDPRAMVEAGVALAPEGRELFASLTVIDNLLLGAYTRRSAFLGRPRRGASQTTVERVFELFPRLAERRDQLAGTLSGGEGQMLAIGRALMSEPRLLMLDEPSLGLAPMVVAEIFRTLVRLESEGLTILLVEQNARAALEIADRGYVIETGRIVAEGEARALLESPEIQAAYLGGPATTSLLTQT